MCCGFTCAQKSPTLSVVFFWGVQEHRVPSLYRQDLTGGGKVKILLRASWKGYFRVPVQGFLDVLNCP